MEVFDNQEESVVNTNSVDYLTHANTMAAYNQWMNQKLYQASAILSDEQRKKDQRVFFKSIHGTLNHLILADRIWMGRFTGKPYVVPSLGYMLTDSFEELRQAREAEDQRIIDWAGSLDRETVESELHFTPMTNPQPRTLPMWLALTHFFNHQTHHRGQLTTLLFQLGIDPGVTDLPFMPGLS